MPKRIERLQGVRAVAIAASSSDTGDHSLVLAADGTVFSFGNSGREGELEHGDTSSVLEPKRIDSLRSVRVVAIATGADLGLALSAAGEVYSWGTNRHGEAGHGGMVLATNRGP